MSLKMDYGFNLGYYARRLDDFLRWQRFGSSDLMDTTPRLNRV